MKNLKTTYMGIELDSPIILGASDMSSDLDMLKKAEEHGVAAIVYKSLFEEQIQLEKLQLDEKLTEFDDINAEMLTMHPKLEYNASDAHLLKIRKAKECLNIPLIASLNAVNDDTWINYAKLLCETGVDGLELNFYQNVLDFNKSAKEIEDEQLSVVAKIKQNITIPVSVKLSADYTNILSFIKRMDLVGVDAFVLFNSFFQPDIDINKEEHIKASNLSNKGDYKKSLRYSGLLFNNIHADICSSHGVFTGADVIKLILSGSTCVQLVSTLYRHGFAQMDLIRKDLVKWMDLKNYECLDDFRGKLSNKSLLGNPFVYQRAQYVDLLINSEEVFNVPR